MMRIITSLMLPFIVILLIITNVFTLTHSHEPDHPYDIAGIVDALYEQDEAILAMQDNLKEQQELSRKTFIVIVGNSYKSYENEKDIAENMILHSKMQRFIGETYNASDIISNADILEEEAFIKQLGAKRRLSELESQLETLTDQSN